MHLAKRWHSAAVLVWTYFGHGSFSITASYKCDRIAEVCVYFQNLSSWPEHLPFRRAHGGKYDCERNYLQATFWSSQDADYFCFSGLQEDALKSAPTRNQVFAKPEPLPSITKSASVQGSQAGPVLVPHRPPPKVPATKKPVPLQRTGVKAENVR